MKHPALLLTGALLLMAADAAAQQDPDISTNSFFRVVQSLKNTVTNRYYPWPPVQPPGYAGAPGVQAGTRTWTYAPPLRSRTAHQGTTTEYIVTGFTQAIFVGAANNNTPITNHYQFATGIGPARQSLYGTPEAMEHDPAKPDVIFVNHGTVAIPAGTTIYEHSFKLTTPVPVAKGTPQLLFVEFKGGEYREDPNGGQTHGSDWRGGYWMATNPPDFNGFTVGAPPNRVISYTGDSPYRTKIGILVMEPILTATGDHGNRYYTDANGARLANELYRGLAAATADWSTNVKSSLFFDVRAGSVYGSGGSAVVFMNAGADFPGSFPTPWGNLMLNFGDPYFLFLAGLPIGLGPNGEYNGEQTPLPVGALGPGAVGVIVSFQGAVYTSGITNLKLTSKSSIKIY